MIRISAIKITRKDNMISCDYIGFLENQFTVNQYFSANTQNIDARIAPIDRSRLVGHPDITNFTKNISWNEKNGLTVTKGWNIDHFAVYPVMMLKSLEKYNNTLFFYKNYTERQHANL